MMKKVNSNSLPIIVARQKDEKSANYLNTEEYVTNRLSYAEMIERGEPFCFHSRLPLIHAFGPKTFWRLPMKDFVIFGEACDPEDFDEVDDVLDMRRQGNIYGRWYSRYALEGDTGYQSYLRIESVSYHDYLFFMNELENIR